MSRHDKTVLGPVELLGGVLDGTILREWPGGTVYLVQTDDGWHRYQFDLDVERHRIIGRYVGPSTP
jgi:hypothetical protein